MMDYEKIKVLQAPGAKISYLKYGSGPALVMIHGIMSNSIDFGFQFEEFSDRYTCIAPDIRGCGRSEADDPSAVTLNDAVDDIIAVVNAELGEETSFTVLGHSFGGIIAFEMLARYPERIDAIIAVSSPVLLGSNILLKPLVPLIPLVIPFAAPFIANKTLLDIYALKLNMSSKNVTEETRSLISERNLYLDKSDMIVMGALMSSVTKWELNDIPVDSLPAMLVYGDCDILFAGRDAGVIEGKYPGIHINVIKGARHSPMNENPGEFNDVLRDFLTLNIDKS